jgi:CheY-like chemotaxis protein
VPLASEQTAPQSAAAAAGSQVEPSAAAKTLLVIDDEHDVADLTASLLQRSGYQVRMAYGGNSGVEMALEHRPAVALVDIAMPDMDGYEVARRLRQSLPDILLIAVTGLAQESDRLRAREAGFNYHLAKPATITQIEELISKHFEAQAAKK